MQKATSIEVSLGLGSQYGILGENEPTVGVILTEFRCSLVVLWKIYKAIRSLRILHGLTHLHPEAQRARDTELYMSLLNNLRRKVDAGTAQPCIAHYDLEKQTQFGLTDTDLAYNYVLSPPLNAGIGPICIFFHTLLRWWHFQTIAILEVFF